MSFSFFNTLTECSVYPLKTKDRSLIVALFFMIAGSIAIEMSIDLVWRPQNKATWLKQSLLSSGVVAIYFVLVGTIVTLLHKSCREVKRDSIRTSAFVCPTLVSQTLSGVFSFGFGLLLEYIVEVSISHNELNKWKALNSFLLSLIPSVATAAAKTILCLTLFKCINKKNADKLLKLRSSHFEPTSERSDFSEGMNLNR